MSTRLSLITAATGGASSTWCNTALHMCVNLHYGISPNTEALLTHPNGVLAESGFLTVPRWHLLFDASSDQTQSKRNWFLPNTDQEPSPSLILNSWMYLCIGSHLSRQLVLPSSTKVQQSGAIISQWLRGSTSSAQAPQPLALHLSIHLQHTCIHVRQARYRLTTSPVSITTWQMLHPDNTALSLQNFLTNLSSQFQPLQHAYWTLFQLSNKLTSRV